MEIGLKGYGIAAPVLGSREGKGEALSSDQSGQSVIEFLLMLPLLVGMTLLLIKVNTAIQMSIVNQKYARAQALFIAFNSPVFPRRGSIASNFVEKNTNQMVVGVSENSFTAEAIEAAGGDQQPEASTFNIAPRKVAGGSDAPGEEPAKRKNIRIRNTVSLCTQVNVLGDGVPIERALGEQTKWEFCRSQVNE